MKIDLDVVNEIIDNEIKFAIKANPVMAIGMEQIKNQINNYCKYKKQQEKWEELVNE